MLCDDAIQFTSKAKATGVDITLRIGEVMFHCYPAQRHFSGRLKPHLKKSVRLLIN